MYDEGFDAEIIAKILRSVFLVDETLPLEVSAVLGDLRRVERELPSK